VKTERGLLSKGAFFLGRLLFGGFGPGGPMSYIAFVRSALDCETVAEYIVMS